ncbi:MAG: VCBS repeat-containing protein, partial [Elusimicrobiota bacterium]
MPASKRKGPVLAEGAFDQALVLLGPDAFYASGANINLTLSSSTFISANTGTGISLGEGNLGALSLASATVRGSRYGLSIATQAAGASLSVSSITFSSLASGATAIHFLGGTFVSTFSALRFTDAGAVASVNAALLGGGSRITMAGAGGLGAGPAYEDDPSGLVDWVVIPGFSKLSAFLGSAGSSYGLAWADYDKDGDLDLAAANAGTQDEFLLRNDGGAFTKVALGGTAGDSRGLAWGDYDNDGDLDLAVANAGTQDEFLLRNDGGGTFVKVTLTASAGDSAGIAWGDYDNDGDLDLAVAGYSGQDEVLLRNAGGVFTKVTLTGTGGSSSGL